MDTITWKTEYETGIREIDDQHRKLVEMLAGLQQVVATDAGDGEIGTRLMAFVKYTKTHLHDEESLMRRVSYSGYEAHKLQHEQLVTQFVSLLQKLRSGDEITPTDLVDFMRRWLIDHIVEDDAEIGRELHERMNAPAAQMQ